MKIIGLTGGSGAGKTEVCKIFLSNGIESIDTDKTAREVVMKGEPCLGELVEYFSGKILDKNGNLDRKSLAEIAFSSKEKLESLNSITHKYIKEKIARWLTDRKKAGRSAVIIDAPLLFESGIDKSCDYIVSVVANKELRIKRILERDKISREAAEKRLENQKSDEFFIENSDFIIYNNEQAADLFLQVKDICEKISFSTI